MLLQLLARTTRVHLATTPEEREAIYRFRYSIYGRELRREYPGIDHERGVLREPQDDEALLFCSGTSHAIAGTFRARIWDQPPHEIAEELSLQKMPRARIAYLERMMVRRSFRGRSVLPGLIWHGYAELARRGVEACVLTCVPGLARHWVQMGAHAYGAKLVEGASSVEVPLMTVMGDHEHLRRCGSFLTPQMRRLAGTFDASRFTPLFAREAQPISFDEREIAALLESSRPPMFAGVPTPALRAIAGGAFLLDVPEGDLVVRKGAADREMYVVLKGELRVENGARIRAGEPMGEVAFLGTPGVRTATVHAAAASRLLVLRRKFLDELARRDPRAAYTIARNLAGVVADRFAERASAT